MKTKIMKRVERLAIKHLAVFDFDATLVYTIMPDDGRKLWTMATNNVFPYLEGDYGKSVRAWWSRPESLDLEILPTTKNLYCNTFYENHRDTPDTHMVMLTGRLKDLSYEVEAVLEVHNYEFDEYIYNPKGWNTLNYKIRHLDAMVKNSPT